MDVIGFYTRLAGATILATVAVLLLTGLTFEWLEGSKIRIIRELSPILSVVPLGLILTIVGLILK